MLSINTVDTCAIVLSAGQSQRMGYDKALLTYTQGKTFIHSIIEAFQCAKIYNIFVVINPDIHKKLVNKNIQINATPIINNYPELGRFFSIQTALNNIKSFSYFLIHNIDNPFINSDIVKLLYNERKSADCVIPCFNNRNGHPVIFNQKVAKQIKSAPYQSNLRDIIAKNLPKIIETIDESITININTPADYRKYFDCEPYCNFE